MAKATADTNTKLNNLAKNEARLIEACRAPFIRPTKVTTALAASGDSAPGSSAAVLCSAPTESAAAAAVGRKALRRRLTFRSPTHPPVVVGAEAIKKKAEFNIAAARLER